MESDPIQLCHFYVVNSHNWAEVGVGQNLTPSLGKVIAGLKNRFLLVSLVGKEPEDNCENDDP